MGITTSLTTFAKGGGCFLAGTLISTPDGDKAIETLKAGDSVFSYNEKTGDREISKIGSIDVLDRTAYYEINGSIKATAEHPFYTNNGIQEVQHFDSTTKLIDIDGNEVAILSYLKFEENVTVYNLLDVLPNNNYFASNFLVHNKGGGCFLAGTLIKVIDSNGKNYSTKQIQNLKGNETLVTLNTETGEEETSTYERLDRLVAQSYYIINDSVWVTGEHPFYTENGIVKVEDLRIGDTLIKGHWNLKTEKVTKIEYVEEDVVIYNIINVENNHNYYANNFLVHNKGGGGGHASSGGHSSSSSSSRGSSSSSSSGKSTSSSTGKSPSTSANKSANSSSSKSTTSAKTAPGTTVTANGKTVKTSTVKPANKSQAGITGVDGYSPKFKNGYTPPAGSVVYYPQHSALDYLPWVYLFSQHSPQNDSATTVQPDGKQVTAQPVQEGVDGLAVFNWILLIVIALAIIAGIVWGINKVTTKDKPVKKSSYYDRW